MKLYNSFLWLYIVLVTYKSKHIKAQKGKMSECDIAYLHVYLPLLYLICLCCMLQLCWFQYNQKIAAIEHGYQTQQFHCCLTIILGSTGPGSICTEGDVRLVEGGNEFSGRVRCAFMVSGGQSVVTLHPGVQLMSQLYAGNSLVPVQVSLNLW